MHRLTAFMSLAALLLGAVACDEKIFSGKPVVHFSDQSSPQQGPAASARAIGMPLYPDAPPPSLPAPSPSYGSDVAREPIVIPDCHLAVIEKEDVPSQRDGVLLFIGTPIQPGEQVPPDRIITVTIGSEEKAVRQWREGDMVRAGQLLAQLDDRLQRQECAIKNAKIASSKADLAASEKTRDEAKHRYETESKMASSGMGVTTPLEVRAAKLAWDRFIYDAASKNEAVRLAELESSQAQTVLQMHQIRSAISGVIKTIHKKPGEAVQRYEPVLQIQNLSRLRVEGLVDSQYVDRLHKGMRVIIEPARTEGPEQILIGHLQEVTSVAVTSPRFPPSEGVDSKRASGSQGGHLPSSPPWQGGERGGDIVSGSADGTIRVWDRTRRRERRVLVHPAPVRAVACTAPGTKSNWCLSGAADGKLRLWDLDRDALAPVREFQDRHHGAVTCVAFSPDGKLAASGSEDGEICLWDTTTGTLHYRLPKGHHGSVTSLQFIPRAQLVSAGRDNTWRLWTLGQQGARLETTLDHRSGDVTCLGVSRDGEKALFDQGKWLRILSLPDCRTAGVLQNPLGATNFSTLALFSPDGNLILTASAAERRLQIWRTPTATTRSRELCQLIAAEQAPATCAAFAPDNSFLVTGTRDRQVLVWPVPTRGEIEQSYTGVLTLIERSVESPAGQVRIWAELDNPDGRLLPGAAVTMVIDAPD